MPGISSSPIRILGYRTEPFVCAEPDRILRYSPHTPLSQAVTTALTSLIEHHVPHQERSMLGLIGLSRSGEIETLRGVTEAFQAKGLAGIDPILFAKANQFFTLFAASKHFGAVGPASSLFSTSPHAADLLYFAAQALTTQADTSRIAAVSYDAEANSGDGSIQGTVCAVLMGTDAISSPGEGVSLQAVKLGPYATTGERRRSVLGRWIRSLTDTGCSSILMAPSDGPCTKFAEENGWSISPLHPRKPMLAQVLDRLVASVRENAAVALHAVPFGCGNAVSLFARGTSVPAMAEGTR